MNYVSPNFFRTVEMPLVSGSGFERRSGSGPRESRRSSTNASPSGSGSANRRGGQALDDGRRRSELDIEIVGIVRDAKYSEVKPDVPPQVFMLREAGPVPRRGELLRAQRSRAARAARGRRASRSRGTMRTCRSWTSRTVAEQAQENVFLDRFMSTLAGALAVMATVLAAIGIYGVLSYGVVNACARSGCASRSAQRRRTCARMVLKQVGWMAAIGIVVGVGLALLLGQVGRALLFGLSPTDPVVPAAAVLALDRRRVWPLRTGPRGARRMSILSLHCAAIEPRRKHFDSLEDKTMNATATLLLLR